MAVSTVTLLWHMHQPDYRHPATGRPVLPWVRLHAASSYLDMAAIIGEPESEQVRVTVNFVPSLLLQLEALEAGTKDTDELLSEKPASELGPVERVSILQRFFSVHWGRQVQTRGRYRELAHMRSSAPTLEEVARRFSVRDFTDLQVLFHLAWIGFALRKEEPWLADLERKGAGFSEEDKLAILALVRKQAGRIIPMWRKLADSGRVELITSPLHHPIVPLLCDTDTARRAVPDATLPRRFACPEDGRSQIRKGIATFERFFGHRPRGMWPPEGSLSPEAVALYAEAGIEWLAGDEEVLFQSIGVRERDHLSCAYRFGNTTLIFRDRELSDRIGFSYATWSATDAAQNALELSRRRSGLVAIILDGENAWESFAERGGPFLRALHRTLSTAPGVKMATVSSALETGAQAALTPPRPLPHLHSGSWIDARFAIWIGDPEKNRAWEALGQARAALGAHPEALEHIYVAEGSDWFWWYGEPFSSAEDAVFDELFRSRLQAAYRAAGREPPASLGLPISQAAARPSERPTRFIHPTIDGMISSFFEWTGAGRFDVPRGAVMSEGVPLLEAVHYGFDHEHLYLRLDPFEGRGRADPLEPLRGKTIRVILRQAGRHVEVTASIDEAGLPQIIEVAPQNSELGQGEAFARHDIVELSVRFGSLGLTAKSRADLLVRIEEKGKVLVQVPREGALVFDVPDEWFEAENWSV